MRRGSQPPYFALMAIIRDRVNPQCAEQELWLAVLGQAVFDAYLSTNKEDGHWVRDAQQFFHTENFVFVCDLLAVEPDWVRRQIKKFAISARSSQIRIRQHTARRMAARQTNKLLRLYQPNQKTAHASCRPINVMEVLTQ